MKPTTTPITAFLEDEGDGAGGGVVRLVAPISSSISSASEMVTHGGCGKGGGVRRGVAAAGSTAERGTASTVRARGSTTSRGGGNGAGGGGGEPSFRSGKAGAAAAGAMDDRGLGAGRETREAGAGGTFTPDDGALVVLGGGKVEGSGVSGQSAPFVGDLGTLGRGALELDAFGRGALGRGVVA